MEQKKDALTNKLHNSQISELLCFCEQCETPFQSIFGNYTQSSKIKCAQCGSYSVVVIRNKPLEITHNQAVTDYIYIY